MAAVTTSQAGEGDFTVSVIMIFRDAEAFIAEAIDSVLAQTLTEWELLLVDDGSVDGSSRIAADYADRWQSKIRLLSHPGHENRGMSASRNLGLQAAQGRYVAFLDADDVYLPQRLQRHVDILERMPDVDMVQSELIHWYSWEPAAARRDDDYVRPFLRPDDHLLTPPEGLLLAIAVPMYSIGICNITVRRQALLALGGFEPQFRAAFEDQVALAKLYLHKTTYVLQAHLVRYRRHPGSWTRRAKEQSALASVAATARWAFCAWLVDYVDRSGIRDPLLDAQLQPLRASLATPGAGDQTTAHPRLSGNLTRVALRTLPRSGVKALLRWNRAREFREARAQYVRLCAALRRAGRTDESGLLGTPVPLTVPGTVAVSVIMIFRDAVRFMDEAIQSVLAQTFKDWELLLVDDGSTDASTELARRYAALHPEKIRYLEHPGHANRGTGPSRNLGLVQASGRYATFLDADDVYLPERLARHADVLATHTRARLVISHEVYWHQWSRESGPGAVRSDEVVGPVTEYATPVDPPVLLRTALRKRGAAMPTPSSITFDRQLALDIGSIPERFTSQYEDQALIAKLMLVAVAVVLDTPLVKYRQHEASLTHRLAVSGEYRPGRPHEAYFDFLQWLRDYVAESAPQFPELDSILSRRLWPTRYPALSRAYESARSAYRALRGRSRR